MNKKAYIKPELTVEEMIIETPMLTSSFTFEEEGGNEESLSNDRRGDWGNLWE